MHDIPAGIRRVDIDVSDLADLAELVSVIEASDNPPFRTSVDEVEQWFSDATPMAITGWRDAEGHLVAYGRVRTSQVNGSVVHCEGGVAPAWRGRGLGQATNDWQTQQARTIIDAGTGSGHILIQVEATNEGFEQHLVRAGYTCSAAYLELERPTNAPIPLIDIPPMIAVSPWRKELDDEIRRAFNRMGRDNGSQPFTTDQWRDSRAAFLPEASVVAQDCSTDRSRVIGFLIASVYTQDWDAVGTRQGYIDMYGLDEAYDSTILSAMIATSISAFAKMSLDTVGISAAADDDATLAMLNDLGFRTNSVSREYVMAIEPQATT